MKIFNLLLVTSLLAVLPLLPAHALSFGSTGDAYQKDNATWQDVYVEGSTHEITASIPGYPSSSLENGIMSIASFYKDTLYLLSVGTNDYLDLPDNATAFIAGLNSPAEYKPIKCKKPHVSYAVKHTFLTKDGAPGLTHIYVTARKMYMLSVVGDDDSLKKQFFDSFQVVRVSK